MEKIRMFDRKKRQYCDVYGFDIDKLQAVVFSLGTMEQTNGGSGWDRVPLKRLIPEEYACDYVDDGFMSKTKKNHYKSKLTLKSAVWETTDGMEYNNVYEAIKHQAELENDPLTEEELNGGNQEECIEETAIC